MNFFIKVIGVAMLLVMIVTCSNIQTLRDEFATKPNKIEQSIANWINRISSEDNAND